MSQRSRADRFTGQAVDVHFPWNDGMIRFECICGRQLQARDEDLGKKAQCPSCQHVLTVPAESRSPRFEKPIAPAPGPTFSVQPGKLSRSAKARAALILGLLTPVFCGLPALPAFVLGILALRDLARADGQMVGKGHALGGIAAACLGLILTITAGIPLVYWFDTWREGRGQSENAQNLARLGTAMLAFAENNSGQLPEPTAFRLADGRPGLSWRVALLPYLGQEDLYQRFHLDEPWDSDHNRKLIAEMPNVFALPGKQQGPRGRTYYQVFVGPRTLFDPGNAAPGKPGQLRLGLRYPTDIPDGVGQTLMIATARNPIVWTQPEDLALQGISAVPPLGGHYPGGYDVTMADGTVRLLEQTTPEEVLRAMITRNGGESLP